MIDPHFDMPDQPQNGGVVDGCELNDGTIAPRAIPIRLAKNGLLHCPICFGCALKQNGLETNRYGDVKIRFKCSECAHDDDAGTLVISGWGDGTAINWLVD